MSTATKAHQAAQAASTEVAKRPSAYQLLEERLDTNTESVVRACKNSGMDVEGFKQAILNATVANTDILGCDLGSVVGAALVCAATGLQPGPLGYCYIVPYNTKRDGRWVKYAQFQMGYKGFIKLGYETGLVANIYAEAVVDGDTFAYALGTDPYIKHIPKQDINRTDPAKVTHVYSVIIRNNGLRSFKVMTRAEVERIRSFAKAGTKPDGPWSQHWVAMAKKTCLRDHFKTEYLGDKFSAQVMQDEKTVVWNDRLAKTLDRANSTALAAKDETPWDIPEEAGRADKFEVEVIDIDPKAAEMAEGYEEMADENKAVAEQALAAQAEVCDPEATGSREDVSAVIEQAKQVLDAKVGSVAAPPAATDSSLTDPSSKAHGERLATDADLKGIAITIKTLNVDEALWRAHLKDEYGVESRKQLTHAQAYAFIRWLGQRKRK